MTSNCVECMPPLRWVQAGEGPPTYEIGFQIWENRRGAIFLQMRCWRIGSGSQLWDARRRYKIISNYVEDVPPPLGGDGDCAATPPGGGVGGGSPDIWDGWMKLSGSMGSDICSDAGAEKLALGLNFLLCAEYTKWYRIMWGMCCHTAGGLVAGEGPAGGVPTRPPWWGLPRTHQERGENQPPKKERFPQDFTPPEMPPETGPSFFCQKKDLKTPGKVQNYSCLKNLSMKGGPPPFHCLSASHAPDSQAVVVGDNWIPRTPAPLHLSLSHP